MSFQELIEKEREQRRTYILDAAEELFFAKGFSRVSMDEIAKKVGMNKATIYIYFEDKDSLFFGIILRKMRIYHRIFGNAASQEGTGRERIKKIGTAGFAFSLENRELFRLFGTAGPELFRDTDNPLAKVILEILMKELFIIRDVLNDGIADGSVRSDLDPREMAGYLMDSGRSITCMDPGRAALMEAEGIGYQQYVADYLRFIDSAIAYPEADRQSPVKKKRTVTRKTGKNP